MRQPPGTPAKRLITVGDLRQFLDAYEADDHLLVMLHSHATGAQFPQYMGYYPMGGTDQEGNPVLFINEQESCKERSR